MTGQDGNRKWHAIAAVSGAISVALIAYNLINSGTNKRIDDLRSDFTAGFADIKADIKTVEAGVADVKAEIKTVEAEIADVKADIKTVKAEIADVKADIKTVKVDVDALQRDMVLVLDALARIEGRQIADVGGTVPAVGSTLAKPLPVSSVDSVSDCTTAAPAPECNH